MSDSDDDLMFLDDGDSGAPRKGEIAQRWKMLVVDDDREVHSITKLVLADFSYKGRQAEFLSAYSAAEAAEILAREEDIAVILLDVVMETDDAGLRLVHHIREILRNRHVRIILRTGQPGQAPERDVIVNYDINDYKAKTELTAQKLFTTTVAALRSYEDIMTIETNRRGLEKIIEASASLFQLRSMKLFAAGVLTQLSAIIGIGPDAILCVQRGSALGRDRTGLYVLAGSGRFEQMINEPATEHIDPAILSAVHRCLEDRRNFYEDDHCTLYIRTPNDRETVVYLYSDRPLNDLDQELIEVFCSKISVGFDNLYLYEQLRRTQEATVVALADLAEYRDVEMGDHVARVTDLTEGISRALRENSPYADQIDDVFQEQVGLAAALHDIGKVVVDPKVLLKPGPLDDEEKRLIRDHAATGCRFLERAGRLVDGRNFLALGAEIAKFHHESHDGSGYPEGRKGADIPLSARIAAVVDTYDALRSRRSYKEPWSHGDAVTEIRRQSGTRFDPVVVEAFLKAVDDGAF
ncbi:MAG TPA: DUF3369 domain-containing protein [Azospirillaceae bacterium]|nr:DUF3369 domain-containing protein [Azospirillaceae bacterium]